MYGVRYKSIYRFGLIYLAALVSGWDSGYDHIPNQVRNYMRKHSDKQIIRTILWTESMRVGMG